MEDHQMKRGLLSGPMAFLSVVLLSGCQDRGTDPLAPGEIGPAFHGAACKGHHSNDEGCGGGGGGDPPEDTPLTVTIADRTGGGGGITNDDKGAYSDGVDLVVAHVRPPGIGTFVFETAEGTAGKNSPTPARLVCMDFNGQANSPFQTGCVDVFANTPGGAGELDFHDLTTPGSTALSGFQMFWRDGTVEWFLRYDGGCGEAAPPNGSRVTVTRLENGWTIEAPDGLEAMLCTWPLKGKPVWTKIGDFTMPFFMTLDVR
jgi:hypothetical protein